MSSVDVVYVQVPEDLRYRPRYWDPRLAYQMAEDVQEGLNVTHVDWALYRINVNVVKEEIQKYKYGSLVLWGGPETYRYMKQLQPHIKDYVVMGMPRDVARRLSLPWRKDVTMTYTRYLPTPNLSLFDANYFQESRLPFTPETTLWERRVPLQFRYKRKLKDWAAAVLTRQFKIRYWWDSVDWLDDVTEDPVWTEGYLKKLNEFEVGFQFICRANIDTITPGLLASLREAGCKVVDYGAVKVSRVLDDKYFARLQGAMVETRKVGVFPTFTLVLDRDAGLDACVEATKLMLSVGGLHKPQIEKPYHQAKTEEEILEMNRDEYNPTTSDWRTLLGIQSAMERGMLRALEDDGGI